MNENSKRTHADLAVIKLMEIIKINKESFDKERESFDKERAFFLNNLQNKDEQIKSRYSEEDVVLLLQKYRLELNEGKTPNIGDTTKDWFDKYKKK